MSNKRYEGVIAQANSLMARRYLCRMIEVVNICCALLFCFVSKKYYISFAGPKIHKNKKRKKGKPTNMTMNE